MRPRIGLILVCLLFPFMFLAAQDLPIPYAITVTTETVLGTITGGTPNGSCTGPAGTAVPGSSIPYLDFDVTAIGRIPVAFMVSANGEMPNPPYYWVSVNDTEFAFNGLQGICVYGGAFPRGESGTTAPSSF